MRSGRLRQRSRQCLKCLSAMKCRGVVRLGKSMVRWADLRVVRVVTCDVVVLMVVTNVSLTVRLERALHYVVVLSVLLCVRRC